MNDKYRHKSVRKADWWFSVRTGGVWGGEPESVGWFERFIVLFVGIVFGLFIGLCVLFILTLLGVL